MTAAESDTRHPPVYLTLGDVVSFAWRQRLTIALTFVVVMVVVAVAYKLVPREYRADVVLVPVQDVSVDLSSAATSGVSQVTALLGGTAASSWRQESLAFLRSRQLARSTIRALGLLDDLVPLTEQPEDIANTDDVRMSRAVLRFQKQTVRVGEERLTGIVTVSAFADQPAKAVSIANGFVAEANRLARDNALERLASSADYQMQELSTTSSIEVRSVLLTLIERNYKALSLARARPDYAYRVIDPAVPGGRETAVWPRLTTFAAFGGITAGVLAVALALLVDLRRRRRS